MADLRGGDGYPAHEELLLVGRLRGERREFGSSHQLKVSFYDVESGEVISSVDNTVTVPDGENMDVSLWHFVYRLTSTFASPGHYAADVIIDGDVRATLPMYVWTFD